MGGNIVTVFGGTGFLGTATVRALANAGWKVRVAARRPERVDFSDLPEVETIGADIRDPGVVRQALDGAEAVVNAVSLYVEHWNRSFDDIHVRGAAELALAAREKGLRNLVHISGIGTDEHSPSHYVRARARGEHEVRETFPRAVILRPSVLFGPGDSFLSTLDGITRLPVIPLFGRGETRLQPVQGADVARAVAASLESPEATGQVFELGGATVHTYREIVEKVLAQRGRKRILLPLPYSLWSILATVLAVLPNPPLTRDQLILMRSDNVADNDRPGFSELGITPAGLADTLEESLY